MVFPSKLQIHVLETKVVMEEGSGSVSRAHATWLSSGRPGLTAHTYEADGFACGLQLLFSSESLGLYKISFS